MCPYNAPNAPKIGIKFMKKIKGLERTEITKIGNWFKSQGLFFFKIPDMPHGKIGGTRFDIKKPFDSIITFLGCTYAIEFKMQKNLNKFNLAKLRPNQIIGLENWEINSSGSAFVFLILKTDCIYRCLYIHWPYLRDKKELSGKELIAWEHFVDLSAGYDFTDFILYVQAL